MKMKKEEREEDVEAFSETCEDGKDGKKGISLVMAEAEDITRKLLEREEELRLEYRRRLRELQDANRTATGSAAASDGQARERLREDNARTRMALLSLHQQQDLDGDQRRDPADRPGPSSMPELRRGVRFEDAPLHSELPRLAPLTLPTFDGAIQDWDFFIETFRVCVDRHPITKIEKFTRLIEALKGPALQAVSGLRRTGDNYEVALTLLEDRFGRAQTVRSHLMEELKGVPLPGNDIKKNRKNYDLVRGLLSELELRSLRSSATPS